MAPRREDRYPRTTRAKVQASGHSIQEAVEADEVALAARLGSFVLLATVLAFVVGFLLAHFGVPARRGTVGAAAHWTLATAVGLFFGFGVFTIDRWIVSTVYDRDTAQVRLTTTLGRLVLTIPLALAAAWSIMVVVAGSLVGQQLQSDYQDALSKVRPATATVQAQSDAQAALDRMTTAVSKDQTDLTTAQDTQSSEEQGHAPSRIAGCGNACIADGLVVDQARAQLHRDKDALPGLQQALKDAQKAVGASSNVVQDRVPEPSDLFARHRALGEVEKTNPDVKHLAWIIEGIIIGFDLAPALYKSMAPRSALDEYVVTRRRVHRNRATAWLEGDADALAGARETIRAARTRSVEADVTISDLAVEQRLQEARSRATEGRASRRDSWVRPLLPRRRLLGLTAATTALLVTAGLVLINAHTSGYRANIALRGGGVLAVPHGAISGDSPVNISYDTAATPAWPYHKPMSDVIKIRTKGNVVGQPALEFPVPGELAAAARSGALQIAYRTDRGWQDFPAEYDQASGMMVAHLTHFSDWRFWQWDWPSLGAQASQTLGEWSNRRAPGAACTNGQPVPGWVNLQAGVGDDAGLVVRSCAQGQGDVLDVELVNNRKYGLLLNYEGNAVKWGWHEPAEGASNAVRDAVGDLFAHANGGLYLPPLARASVGIIKPARNGALVTFPTVPTTGTIGADVVNVAADKLLPHLGAAAATAYGQDFAQAALTGKCGSLLANTTGELDLLKHGVGGLQDLLTSDLLGCLRAASVVAVRQLLHDDKLTADDLSFYSGVANLADRFNALSEAVGLEDNIGKLLDFFVDKRYGSVPDLGFGFSVSTHYVWPSTPTPPATPAPLPTQHGPSPAPTTPAVPPRTPSPVTSSTPPSPTPRPTPPATPQTTTPPPSTPPSTLLAHTATTAWENYGAAALPGHPVCRGNGNNLASWPGGTVEQTLAVPSGVTQLTGYKVQLDGDSSVTSTLSVYVDGALAATSSAVTSGDTTFSFGPVSVRQGQAVRLSLSFSATSGKIVTAYTTAGTPGGTVTITNSCPDTKHAFDFTSSTVGLRAEVLGTT